MSLSDVIRNIARTVTNKDELKEKAKDLPLLVVQTTLSAAGQALLLVDRMKNSIKGIGGKQEREEEYDSRPSAAEQVAAAPAETSDDKTARKEPVIFAPRSGAAEPNGVARTKPDPVIFAPAPKPSPVDDAESVAVAEPQPEAAPKASEPATRTEAAPQPAGETATPAATESKAVTDTIAEPETTPAPKPVSVETPAPEAAVVETPAAAEAEAQVAPAAPKPVDEPAVEEPAVEEPAEAPVAKPKATRTRKPAPKAGSKTKAEPATAPEPAAATAEPAPAPEPPAAPEPVTAAPVDLTEPLPGWSELTVASLRARMRGKTAEQIGGFLAYEQATKARPEVIKMFENRLAKLQAGE
ncbi:hypothetical protein FXF51_24820 [Nonomuraea sp. PA05]|uniref:hypothetical protein n=1 Tax=Nonomuraea sp. PA05 TaxID=2604466 RepID=UPI0011DBDDFE|nr:hypothetical protein [Nonomuraea sp. PA05]TYB62664.1 hypothetical protein FXF51_24820 [Nonomuraea sp. PA05]